MLFHMIGNTVLNHAKKMNLLLIRVKAVIWNAMVTAGIHTINMNKMAKCIAQNNVLKIWLQMSYIRNVMQILGDVRLQVLKMKKSV